MKNVKIIFCTIFLLFITIIGIGTLNNHNALSEEENRTLTTFPEFDFSKLLDTSYLDTITTAVSDQLEWRSNFVKLYYKLNKNILKQSYVGNVVVGKNEVLFTEPIDISDWDLYKRKIVAGCEKINEVNEVAKEYGTKLIVVDIPRKDIVLRDYVPSYYPDNGKEYLECLEVQKANLENDISVIDVYTLFKENKREDGQLYFFYNDHHINALGNELILAEIMKIVKVDYPEVEQYKLDRYNILKKQVHGSFNKKIAMTAKAPDEILNIVPDGWNIEYTRYDNGILSEEPVLDADAISYSSAFMGGNIGETIVETNRKDLPSIFYCGYSFTNALEALSVPSFNNVYSVDFRHNETDNKLIDYIEKWQPEYVVLISAKSTSTFKYANVLINLGLDKNIAKDEFD